MTDEEQKLSDECKFTFNIQVTCESGHYYGEGRVSYEDMQAMRAIFDEGLLQWFKGVAHGEMIKQFRETKRLAAMPEGES